MTDTPKQLSDDRIVKHETPAHMRPTPPNAVMLDSRVEYLKQTSHTVTADELRRFIDGWEHAKAQPIIERPIGSGKAIKVDGKVYLEYTDWNEKMAEDQRLWGKKLSEERDAAYTRGLKKGTDLLEEVRAKAFAEGEKNVLEARFGAEDEAYTKGVKHGRESAWEALDVRPTKEADVAEPHIHEQIDRTTPIAAEGQYVNPGAELARRQKIVQDGKSFDSFADLAEGDSIYDLSKYTAQEGVNDEQEVEDLTDVVEEVATEAVGAESAGIFTEQLFAEQNGIVNDDVEEVVPDGVLKEWFNKGYAAGAQEQDDALEAIKATEEGSVLLDAIAIVQGRRDEYGAAEDSFATIGGYWSVALTQIVGRPVVLSAEDVARMMILLKVARDTEQPKRDNPVDIAGYAGMLQRVRA